MYYVLPAKYPTQKPLGAEALSYKSFFTLVQFLVDFVLAGDAFSGSAGAIFGQISAAMVTLIGHFLSLACPSLKS